MRRKLAAATVALVALSATGCGGGSSSLSQAEFTKQAEAVCTRSLKPLQTMPHQRQELVVKAQVAYFEKELAGLARLKPPGSLAGAFADYKASLESRRDLYRKVSAAVGSGASGSAQMRSLEAQQGEQFLHASKLVRELGLKSCR